MLYRDPEAPELIRPVDKANAILGYYNYCFGIQMLVGC